MGALSYNIDQALGILSQSEDGQYTTEVNMISYNDKRPKLDIRRWNKKDGKMLKGVALSWEETQKLVEILQELTGADFR